VTLTSVVQRVKARGDMLPAMQRRMELAVGGSMMVLRERQGVALFEATGTVVRVSIDHLHAFAAVGTQVWIVAGPRPVLTAYDRTGTPLAAVEVASPGTRPRLVPATGSLHACWIGDAVSAVYFDRKLVATPLSADVEFALPLSSTRTLVWSRGRITLREQDGARWSTALPPFKSIHEAAVVFDGKAVAVSAEGSAARAIVVIGLRDGAILHRINVPACRDVRFASRRGVALVHTSGPHLLLIDLRFGRVLLEHDATREIAEAAIDDHGASIVLRFADEPDAVVSVSVAELVREAQSRPAPALVLVPDPAPVATDDAPRDEEPGDIVAIAQDPFASDGGTLVCSALPPRPALEVATFEQIRALNSRYRVLAISLVSRAIARAWDEGRLAYPQTIGLPFHSEVAGVASGQTGLAAEEVHNAERRHEAAAQAVDDIRDALLPRVAPIDALARELELSETAKQVLLVVAAPSLWGELARLYGILSNDDGRPLVDEHLVSEILSHPLDPVQIAAELDASAPLIRQGIVRARAGKMRPFLPLVVDPVVLRQLRGVEVETELQPLTQVLGNDRSFDELRIPTATKRALVEDLRHATGVLRIAIRGRVGSGRHTLLAAIAAASGRRLGVIDAAPLVRDPRVRLAELSVLLERAQIAGLLPCVDGLEVIASEDVATRDQVREILRRHPGPLAVRLSWEARPPLDPGYVAIDLPTLTLSERLVCWERTLATHQLRVRELDELGDRYAVGPGVIERVAAEVSRGGDISLDAGQRLEAGIRQHLESRLGTTANRVARLASWEQVILPADIQDSLTELIARIKHRRIVFDQWGFDRVMSTSRGVSALFQGGPGTGKTLVASAIANELGMDLYRVDLSRVMSKWIGETEQNLAKLFDAAEDGNAIILFDEADSLFAKRTEVKSSVDRYANLEVNYLLQRIDTFEGIAILTTNFGTSIDNAFKRRLSLRLTFPFPDDEMREKLWRAHLPAQVPTNGPLDFSELARKYRLSGGYIRNCTLRAAFLAVEEHTPLTMDHLERAIKAEFREIGKIAESGVLE
jgi:hypothetical protein